MTGSNPPSDTVPQTTASTAAKDQQTAALLAAIVESSEDAIASKTLDGIVTSWNLAAEHLFGFTAEEMIGESILRIIPPELHHEETLIQEQLRKGNRIERYETTRVRKDRHVLHISLTISPIRDLSGQIVGAAKIAHDITALRDREAQLRQVAADREVLLQSERSARVETERLGRLKDEFLATLSHELRTPLNAIQGWSQILRHERVSPQDYARGLEAIERNVRAQSQIVSDLLDMSRIISGQILLEVRPMSLQEVLVAALDAVRPAADSKGIRIQTLFDPGIGPVRGDPTRLQQVFWNLLTNAVKFTPKGGSVKVVLERVDSHVEVAVEDTGIGIEPDFLPFVFERFRQADAGIARRHGGLGLGLSIVKNLVEQHGGSVRAKSKGQGQGSTVTVALPLYHLRIEDDREHRRSAADPLRTIDLPRLDGAAVLFVDNDVDGCELVSRILGGQGARVRCTSSGQEALEILSLEQFDVLLSDIGMPDMDGYEFVRRLRGTEHARSRSIPAIAITAYARPEDRQRALLSGYQMHLAKPIEPSELIAAIASLKGLVRK